MNPKNRCWQGGRPEGEAPLGAFQDPHEKPRFGGAAPTMMSPVERADKLKLPTSRTLGRSPRKGVEVIREVLILPAA